MSEQARSAGRVGWVDLTVDDAEGLRDFYADVVGWRPEGCSMGDYEDYNLCDPADGEAQAGVVHRRGVNASQPGGWMVYFTVTDLPASVARCEARGGRVLSDRSENGVGICVIEDPSGAVCALYASG